MGTIDEALSKMKPAFRTCEFISELHGKAAYANTVLYRLKKAGKIMQVKRGWLAKAGTTPLEIACQISYPCYVSFHSALHVHGLTTQIPKVVQLAVCRKARKYEFPGGKTREYRLKRHLFTGFEVKQGIPIAAPEKAFADCLRLPRACPLAVLAEALENVDIWKVKKMCNKRMQKRLKEVENANPRIA